MSIKALQTRVEVEFSAPVSPSLVAEPVEHTLAVGPRAGAAVGYEIVHVEMRAAVEILLNPKSRNAYHVPIFYHGGDPVTRTLHAPNLFEVFSLVQMWS